MLPSVAAVALAASSASRRSRCTTSGPCRRRPAGRAERFPEERDACGAALVVAASATEHARSASVLAPSTLQFRGAVRVAQRVENKVVDGPLGLFDVDVAELCEVVGTSRCLPSLLLPSVRRTRACAARLRLETVEMLFRSVQVLVEQRPVLVSYPRTRAAVVAVIGPSESRRLPVRTGTGRCGHRVPSAGRPTHTTAPTRTARLSRRETRSKAPLSCRNGSESPARVTPRLADVPDRESVYPCCTAPDRSPP